MITSQNSKNKLLYGKLFEAVENYMKNHDANGKASDEEGYDGSPLMGEDTFITSLKELFTHIEVLRKLKPQLTRLPVDEEFFEIDSDKRTIAIPAHFTKDGVFSVAGDEIAESVYFIVDRYFDHMDLATQDIFIQFVNAKNEEYVAVPPVVDLESQPGKMIIEWPISSKVTAAAGNVQFSVRFYTYDTKTLDANGEGNLLYSLSTLPHTIAVKPAQNFDIAHIESVESNKKDNNKDLMETRLSGKSLYEDEGVIQPEIPEFIQGFVLPETINLGKDEKGFTTQPVTIHVQAKTNDVGIINYSWKAADLDNEEVSLNGDIRVALIKTKDAAPVEGKIYYVKVVKSGVTGYSLAGDLAAFDPEKIADETGYYERVGELVIKEAGYYSVNATNKVGNLESVSDVYTCTVPEAQDPKMENIVDRVILSFEENEDSFTGIILNTCESLDSDGKLTYVWQWSKDGVNFEDITIVDEDGKTKKEDSQNLKIVGSASAKDIVLDENGNEILDEEVTEEEFLTDDAKSPKPGLISSGNGIRGIRNDVEGEVPAIFVPLYDEEKGVFSGDGYYRTIVTNNLNKTAKSETTNVCRVTHAAIKPDVVEKSGQTLSSGAVRIFETIAFDNSKGLQVEAVIPDWAHENRTEEDSITYQWYRYSNSSVAEADKNARLEADIKLAAAGKYVVNYDYRIKDATKSTLVLTEDDLKKGNYFFCRVLNTYNGSTAMRCSKLFEVAKLS